MPPIENAKYWTRFSFLCRRCFPNNSTVMMTPDFVNLRIILQCLVCGNGEEMGWAKDEAIDLNKELAKRANEIAEQKPKTIKKKKVNEKKLIKDIAKKYNIMEDEAQKYVNSVYAKQKKVSGA